MSAATDLIDLIEAATTEGSNTKARVGAAMRAILAEAATVSEAEQSAIDTAVAAAVAALVNTAPSALDTLNELAGALGNDANFAATMATTLAGKVTSGGALGTPTSGTLTNCSGLPVGGISGLGTGVGTALGNTLNAASGLVGYGGSAGNLGVTSLNISGNISQAAWTTNGVRVYGTPGTLTDTTSSGTVAAAYTNKLGGNTIAASNATTFTNYYSAYISDPVAGTNVTLTNKWALGCASLLVTSGGSASVLQVDSAYRLTGTSTKLSVGSSSGYDCGSFWGNNQNGIYSALVLHPSQELGWGTSNSVNSNVADALFMRAGAATIQMGRLHATSPTGQTLKAHNVTTGTGASLTLAGGSGSVAKGNVVLDGGNRAAYSASPSAETIRDILISHGLMAAS